MMDETTVERILGFDVRALSAEWAREWPSERRGEYLLRGVDRQPRSVDRMVWPCPPEKDRGISDEAEEAYPNWIGLSDYWEDLAELRRWMKGRVQGAPAIIAVTLVFSALDEEALSAWNRIAYDPERGTWLNFWKHHRPEPDAPSSDWTFLGYDVADLFSLSGLMNCGYSAEDRVSMGEFGPLLNEWHLFDCVEDAQRFRMRTNERVQEHAPFFVYGLWRIPDDSDI